MSDSGAGGTAGPLTETLRLSADISHPLAEVWQAFADTEARVQWGVPAGEEMVYDHDDLRTGGSSQSRCGAPGRLEFRAAGDYIRVEPECFVVHTDTVWSGDVVLATALVTWRFEAAGETTRVEITDQVVSFVGEDMIEGHRNGHTIVLGQLQTFLDGRSPSGDLPE